MKSLPHEPLFFAYIHCRPDGTPFYVGKGSRKRATSRHHMGRNKFYRNVISKYGRDNIIVRLIPCQSEKEAFDVERELIKKYKESYPLANFTDGGEGPSGYKFTEEQLKERSERRLSEEHRRNISLGSIGRIQSEETRRKISERFTEARKKMLRESLRGENNPSKSYSARIKISASKIGKSRPDVASYLGGENSPSKRPDVKEKFSLAKKGRVWMSKEGYTRLVDLTTSKYLESNGWIRGRK